MKSYVLSLLIGWLVGLIYGFSGIRSPAPPVVALVGLLGILAGESTVALLKRRLPARQGAPAIQAPARTENRSKLSDESPST